MLIIVLNDLLRIRTAEAATIPASIPQTAQLPTHVKNMITRKNKIRRKIQSNRTVLDTKRELKVEMNVLTKKIKLEVNKWRNQKIDKVLSDLRPHDTNMYVHVKKLTKKKHQIHP